MEDKKASPWTNENLYKTYEEAKESADKLVKMWNANKQEHMQIKIRRRANNLFLIKYRKDPAFTTKETKNGKNIKKNKRNTKKRKDSPSGTV